MFGYPLYVWTPHMFEHPHMFGWPIYLGGVLMPQYICSPHMFRHPPYVWMPPYIHNTKKGMLCQTKGCPYTPIHLDAQICLEAPVWLDDTHMFRHPPVHLYAPYV